MQYAKWCIMCIFVFCFLVCFLKRPAEGISLEAFATHYRFRSFSDNQDRSPGEKEFRNARLFGSRDCARSACISHHGIFSLVIILSSKFYLRRILQPRTCGVGIYIYTSHTIIYYSIYTSIAARGGGGSFKRLKLYISEEKHVSIESFVTTLIH